jgi:hypothetical protein
MLDSHPVFVLPSLPPQPSRRVRDEAPAVAPPLLALARRVHRLDDPAGQGVVRVELRPGLLRVALRDPLRPGRPEAAEAILLPLSQQRFRRLHPGHRFSIARRWGFH